MPFNNNRPVHLGTIDLTGEDTDDLRMPTPHISPTQLPANAGNPPMPVPNGAGLDGDFSPRKQGRSICKSTALKKYRLSRRQMERIKPWNTTPNLYGKYTHHFNECDVKDLARQVELEKEEKRLAKEQKKNSARKPRSTPKKPAAASATNAAPDTGMPLSTPPSTLDHEVIVIDD